MAHPHDGAEGTAGSRPNGRRSTSHSTTPSAAVLTPPTGLPAVEPTAPPQIPAQRGPTGPGVPPRPVDDAGVRLCACGHPEEMHEHYRPGTDCGACGSRSCGSFRLDGFDDRPSNPLRRLLRRRHG